MVEPQPALLAINERLRDAYIVDTLRGLKRWNQMIRRHGVDFAFKLPDEHGTLGTGTDKTHFPF